MKASMPDNVDVGSAYTLRIAAQDATTGATVPGVKVSGFAIEATAVGQGDLSFGLFKLVPGAGA